MGKVASLLVYACAGLCVYLAVLNRYIVLLRDSRAKNPLMVATFVAMVGGAAVAGLLLPPLPWIAAPVAVLIGAAAGELRRIMIRRRCRGTLPEGSVFHDVRLCRPFTTTDMACHRYRLSFNNWTGAAFRVVHLSDLHVSNRYPIDYFRRVFDVAEEQHPDMVFITGDFINKPSSLDLLSELLRPVGRIGCFAVLGNHDYWADPAAVRTVIADAGIRLLTNETIPVAVGGTELALTGCDNPWGERDWSPPEVDASILHMALSHTPDNIYGLARNRLNCVFCGHYHAGQFRVPLLGAFIIPSIYGRRFDHGHYRVAGTDMFIAAGIGASNPPFRIYCQPDIFVVDISGGV